MIDCVSGYVSALLKLTGGFCFWHGTLLEWSMPRACVEDQSPSQGSGQRNSGRRDCGHVFGNPVRYSLSFWYGTSSNNRDLKIEVFRQFTTNRERQEVT